MRFQDQEALASYVHKKLVLQVDQVAILTGSLNARQRRQPRPDGGWSIDQILAHLARMNETYIGQLERIAAERVTDQGGGHRWSPTISGRVLRWTVTTPVSVRTPKIFLPAALDYPGDPLDAFITSHRALIGLLDRMRNLNWSIHRCSSPASSLVRLNLGDVFLILADHVDRHMKQLEQQRDVVAPDAKALRAADGTGKSALANPRGDAPAPFIE